MLLISENKKMQVKKKISVNLQAESASKQQKRESYEISWSR